MESGDRPFGEAVLQSIDARLERLEREAAAGSVFAAEARDELRLTRLAYGEQIELTRAVIAANKEAFDRNAEAYGSWEQTQAQMTSALTAIVGAANELREEVRAQTRAIFRMLDKFGDEPNPA